MRAVIRNAMVLVLLPLGMSLLVKAQTSATNQAAPDLRAASDPAPPNKGTVPPTNSAGSKEDLQPTMDQKIDALTNRVSELEKQLKLATAALLADSADTAAMKAAERQLLIGSAAPPRAGSPAIASAVPPTQEAPPAPPAGPLGKDPHAPAFSDWDWTWLNGNPRNKDTAFDSKFFTPEIRADVTYAYDFSKPIDNTNSGSSEIFRSNEIQLEQLGLGGDFHLDHAHARFMTQFGMYSTATIRNDPSYAKGQWDIADADRYLSEAYGGYHIDGVGHGLNFDAGIFMSYIGLFSYYNFDNWAYQPSYVSSNTPWFFQGVRIQIFPTEHLKIEPWIINGWQSYGSSNSRKGLGGQIKWTPYPWMNVISNNYGLGHDDLYVTNRGRLHTDNSIEIKYFDQPTKPGLDKMAFSFTGDIGCEFGPTISAASATSYSQLGVACHNTGHQPGGIVNPKQSFIGYMIYNRMWFNHDLHGFTIGGGQINNPGRYLVLLPPINGESASSAALNAPYFTGNPGDRFKAWDGTLTYDYMPRQWFTWRFEYGYRHTNVPYWAGHGGMTPPAYLGAAYGTNNGSPTDFACMDGSPVPGEGQVTVSGLTMTAPAAVYAYCGTANGPGFNGHGGVWFPSMQRDQQYFDIDLLVKF
jgi:Putative beta-barrel porin-2, OmpL-like. bbp2